MKVWHEVEGIGVRDGGRGDEMRDVVVAVKGEVVDGVRRALREVLIVSSMAERERRRKSRRARSLKQNVEVRVVAGVGKGWDMMREDGCGGGRGRGYVLGASWVSAGSMAEAEDEADWAFQNHASLNGIYRGR